jgi:hypothetical protein
MARLAALLTFALCLSAGRLAAQDQTVIIDRELRACDVAKPSADLTPAEAANVIAQALGEDPRNDTYYIVHATEFVPERTTVAEEHWYVYYAGWQSKPWYWAFRDSRQLKRFRESRIMGSSRVGLVYLYVNVPTFATPTARDAIAKHFREQPRQDKAAEETRVARLRGQLPSDAELHAEELAKNARDQGFELLVQLESERYLRAFAAGDRTITSEAALINKETGEELVGLSSTLATSASFATLNTLFYKVAITKKVPAPLENLKNAGRFAFAGQSDATPIYVTPPEMGAVCAGGLMHVKHVPADMLVTAITTNAKGEETQRSKQTFDNEGRYWWDVSFALPVDLRRDVTVDVDAGQVAAKSVERADLFALLNVGAPRDTKRVQWFVPALVYGIPITGKPLKHHLVGFSIGLNYVQLLGAYRLDRRQTVSTGTENGTTVGTESAPAGEKWEGKWVWGINIPVATVVSLFKNNDKK